MDAYDLKKSARRMGADVVGVADLALMEGLETDPADLLSGYCRAISVAVRLADGVMDRIQDKPTPLYQQHYRMVNDRLEAVAVRLAGLLMQQGAKALPLPASQILDRVRRASYLSHKAVAVVAGVGWQGKSLLVVNPEYGPRIRLVTVLTDLPLAADRPLKNKCGSCDACAKACPAGAIRNVTAKGRYASREEAVDLERCARMVETVFTTLPHVTSPICGVCAAVCPWGRS